MEQRIVVADQERLWLGGNIKGGDQMTYCPEVWDFLIDNFHPESIRDIGCGEGHLMEYFYNKGINVSGVEGMQENKNNAPESIEDKIIVHDYTTGPVLPRLTGTDMVISCEFVEHVDEKYMANYLPELINCKVLVITHALPGQDGYHHVSCRSDAYWIDIMNVFGFRNSVLSYQARTVARDKILWQTILIFEKE